MKTIKFIISIIICALFFASCVDKNDSTYKIDSSKYIYPIPDVEVTEDYIIGALYHELDSGYWYNEKDTLSLPAPQYTGTPVLSRTGDLYPYSMKKDFKEDNGTVMRQQLQYAADAGVNFFVIGWNGKGSDTLIWNYLKSRIGIANVPNIVIKYDPGHLFSSTGKSDRPKATDKLDDDKYLDKMLAEIDSLKTYLMDKDYYQKNNGKPIFILNQYYRDGRVKSINYILSRVRERHDFWIVGEAPQWEHPEKYKDTIRSFNAMYEDRMITSNYDRFNTIVDGVRSYYSYMDLQFAYWQKFMQQYGYQSNGSKAEFIPMAMSAFNNRRYSPRSTDYLLERYEKNTGKEEFYRIIANVCKRNVGNSRIIILNSWNNYRDGSGIEPTMEFGTRYLQYTKEYFKVPK